MEKHSHLLLKALAKRELGTNGYEVYVEPDNSPLPMVFWRSYRPDLFGHRLTKGVERFVLVECETNPTSASLIRKRQKLSIPLLQLRLDISQELAFLLVVPLGRFTEALKHGGRRFWEIWLVNPRSQEIILKANKMLHGGGVD